MKIFGEPIVWVLVAMAFVALVTYIERLIDIRRAQIDHDDFLKGLYNILDSGNTDEALAVCDDLNAPLGRIAGAAIRHASSTREALHDSVDAQGRAEIGRLDRRLVSLSLIGQIAPMVGLLGAIIGFIRTVIAMNVPEIVSRAVLLEGMMSAMVPAAFGIAVAIPAAIMYASLRVRLDRAIVDLEAAASQLIGYFDAKKEGAAR